jgi:hypothetical protein
VRRRCIATDRRPPATDGIPVLGGETAPLIPYRLTFERKRSTVPSMGIAGGEVEQQYEISDGYCSTRRAANTA